VTGAVVNLLRALAHAKPADMFDLHLDGGTGASSLLFGLPGTTGFALQSFGALYVIILGYYVWRHFVAWRNEQIRIRRAISMFKVDLSSCLRVTCSCATSP
jgi:hypothetical protein